jgi:hypothetical protein
MSIHHMLEQGKLDMFVLVIENLGTCMRIETNVKSKHLSRYSVNVSKRKGSINIIM